MKCPCCGYENLPGADVCEHCQSSLTDTGPPDDALARSLLEDPVSCLQPLRPLAVSPGSTLAEALELMRTHAVGCVLVNAPDGTLAGILSEHDLLMKCALEAPDPDEVAVAACMSGVPETARPDYPLGCALQRMIVGELRYLPLVDAAGRATGIVSSRDVIAYMAARCRAVTRT